MAPRWLHLVYFFVVLGIISAADQNELICVNAMNEHCGTTCFPFYNGRENALYCWPATTRECLYMETYYRNCLIYLSEEDESCLVATMDDHSIQEVNKAEFQQVCADDIICKPGVWQCFKEIDGYDDNLPLADQDALLCENYHKLAECIKAQSITSKILGCMTDDLTDPDKNAEDKAFVDALGLRDECYFSHAEEVGYGESCKNDIQCYKHDEYAFCGQNAVGLRVCQCGFKSDYVDAGTNSYYGPSNKTDACLPHDRPLLVTERPQASPTEAPPTEAVTQVDEVTDEATEAPEEGTTTPEEVTEAVEEVTEAPKEGKTTPEEVTEAVEEVTEAPKEGTTAPQEPYTEAPIEQTTVNWNDTVFVPDEAESCLQEVMKCYPDDSPTFQPSICGNIETLSKCVQLKLDMCSPFHAFYVAKIEMVHRIMLWDACYFKSCWQPVYNCFGVLFENAIQNGDWNHFCQVTSVSTCLANAKTTCTNFKGGADNELIAEMYIHIHKVMCQQNVQEEKDCLLSVITNHECVSFSFLNPSNLDYGDFCMSQTSSSTCIDTMMQSSTCGGLSNLAMATITIIQTLHEVVCEHSCSVTASQCFEDYFPYGTSISYIDTICADRKALATCLSASSGDYCAASFAAELKATEELLNKICSSTVCSQAEIECYKDINKLALVANDADDHYTIICSLLEATETCLASYKDQCDDMSTVQYRLENYKAMCTVVDNCYRTAMDCISKVDFSGMILPVGAIDVSTLPLCLEKTTTITCLQTVIDECVQNSTDVRAIENIIETIETTCTDKCTVSRRETCYQGITAYLERWWTDGTSLVANGMCGMLFSEKGCLRTITSQCSMNDQVDISQTIVSSIVTSIEGKCETVIQPVPDDQTCVLQGAQCFTDFITVSMSAALSHDDVDISSICTEWATLQTCIDTVQMTCASDAFAEVLENTIVSLQESIESICGEDCSIINATTCVTTVEYDLDYIKSVYACSPYNFGSFGKCRGKKLGHLKKNKWSLNFGFNSASEDSEWAFSKPAPSPRENTIKEAVKEWFAGHSDEESVSTVPIYGKTYDCPPLWPGHWFMNGTGDNETKVTMETSGNTTEVVVEKTCKPKFEWGILCKKFNVSKECVTTTTDECADTITTQITHKYESLYESFTDLCQVTTCNVEKGDRCIDQAFNIFFGYSSYDMDTKERACSSIKKVVKCVEKYYASCSPKGKEIMVPLVERVLTSIKAQCKIDFPEPEVVLVDCYSCSDATDNAQCNAYGMVTCEEYQICSVKVSTIGTTKLITKSCTSSPKDQCDGDYCCSYPGCNEDEEKPGTTPPDDWEDPPPPPPPEDDEEEEDEDFDDFTPPEDFECTMEQVFVKGGKLVKILSESLLEFNVDMDSVCVEWQSVNEWAASIDVTTCSAFTQSQFTLLLNIFKEDKFRFCAPQECSVTTAYECLWGLKEYAKSVMRPEDQKMKSVSKSAADSGVEDVQEEFVFAPPPYELHFCEMAQETMACVNRELEDCPEDTIAHVKEEVYQIEAEYKKWLADSGEEDETCFDACSSSPCHNLGKCHPVENPGPDDDLFTCECLQGYNGSLCENQLCQFDVAIQCALEQFNSTLTSIVMSSSSIDLTVACSTLQEKKTCIAEATDQCPPGHKSAANILTSRVFTTAETICESALEVDDCPNLQEVFDCIDGETIVNSGALDEMVLTLDLDSFCLDYGNSVRTCLEAISGCEQPKALINGYLDSFCPSLTCNVGMAAQCLDNLLLIITYYKEIYLPETTDAPTDPPAPTDPTETDPPAPTDPTETDPPEINPPTKTEKSRKKSRPSDFWKSISWDKSRKTPRASRRHQKTKKASEPKSKKNKGMTQKSRRRRDLRDLVGGVLGDHYQFSPIHHRGRRSAQQEIAVTEYQIPEPAPLPEDPGFCWKVDHYKKCILETSVDCTNPNDQSAFTLAFDIIVTTHNIREKCPQTQCEDDPCHNNAVCVEPDDEHFGYTCKCLPGYSGPHCDLGGECDLDKSQICMAQAEVLITQAQDPNAPWNLEVCKELHTTFACLSTHLMSCHEDEIYYDAFKMKFTFLKYLQEKCMPLITDIDECLLGIDECDQVCEDQDIGYTCSCNDGYVLDKDGKTCKPDIIDPCADMECDHLCIKDDSDTAVCGCHLGYELDQDGKTCNDIDECADPTLNLCDVNATCSNLDGGYTCICPDDLMLAVDGRTCIAKPDPIVECVVKEEYKCAHLLTFFDPQNIHIVTDAATFCAQLEAATECVKKVKLTCQVGDLVIDITSEIEAILLTNQQLYCPIDGCDFYSAKKCINNLYVELEYMKFNAKRDWCSLLDDADLIELDAAYDWTLDDIDDAHNQLCQDKYFCLFVEHSRVCLEESVELCDTKYRTVFQEALTFATLSVPTECESYCAKTQPCMNGGTCLDGSAGYYTCTCPEGFTGVKCESVTGCEPSQVSLCLEEYVSLMPTFFLDKCSESPEICTIISKAVTCVSGAISTCGDEIMAEPYTALLKVVTDLHTACLTKYPDAEEKVDADYGVTCCYCRGKKCDSNECDYEVTCKSKDVCETIYEEAKGMVGIQKRGCKNRNACKAGPQGKKRCQLCCEGDYCNDGNPNQFTYGSLVDECIVDYTVGGDTMPNSCDPEPPECDVEAISKCIYNFNYEVIQQFTTGLGPDYSYICSTYEATKECVSERSVQCSTSFVEYGINTAVQYMESIVKEKCEAPICYVANAELCMANFLVQADYLTSLQQIGQLLMETNVKLCTIDFEAMVACVEGNIVGCTDGTIMAELKANVTSVKAQLSAVCPFPCENNPCMNNGTCVPSEDDVNGFTCICTSDYVGEICDIRNNMFIYGEEAGDVKLEVETVGITTIKIRISQTMHIMNFDQDFFYVSEDGYIIFQKELIQDFENFEEQVSGKDIVAPLFARFDAKCGGVYFHEYKRSDSDAQSRDIFKRANSDIFALDNLFSAEIVVVVTWANMYPEKCEFFSDKTLYPDFTPSTFQVVFAVQGHKTYAICNYLTVDVDNQMPYVAIGYSTREGYVFTLDPPEEGFTGFELIVGNTNVAGRHVFPLFNESVAEPDPEDLCMNWIYTTVDLSEQLDLFRPCPCNLDDAMADLSFGLLDWTTLFSQHLCYQYRNRIRVPSNTNTKVYATQRCCFDVASKALITDGVYAGSLTVVSGVGTSDADAFNWCCLKSNKHCGTYFLRRPPNTCTGYDSQMQALIWGDPHFTSLDRLEYTFNGIGEYILVKNRDEFMLQGRFSRWRLENGVTVDATAITAIAAQQRGYPIVEISLASNLKEISAKVAGQDQSRFLTGKDNTTSIGPIVLTKNSTRHLVVSFPDGWVVDVQASLQMLELQLSVPKSAFEKTLGLLGIYNGDESDDLQSADGVSLSPESTLREIHYNFGETWRITKESDSLFTHENGKTVSDYSDPSFVPAFEPPCTTDAEIYLAKEICGDNFACKYDYCVTKNASLAARTRNRADAFNKDMNVLYNTAPVLNGPSEINVTVGETVIFYMEYTDAENDLVEIEMVGSVKEFATFDPTTGEFRWTPQSHSVAVEISFIARDQQGSISAIHYVTVNMCSGCSKQGFCSNKNFEYISDSTTFRLADCTCHTGYTGDHCADEYDGCTNNPCQGASCRDLTPAEEADRGTTYECGTCLAGLVNVGGTCVDEDECKAGKYNCPLNAQCVNRYMGYSCRCKENYMEEGGLCIDINECATPVHGCSHKCINHDGGYKCDCEEGYALEEDQKTCVEEDKVTITTTIGRHVALQMTIDAEWLDDLSNMDSATAAQWSARYVQMLSKIYGGFRGVLNFKVVRYFKSSIGTVLAVIFDHELTAAEKSDVANAFEEFLNNNVNLGGTDYTITSQPAIILNNKAIPIEDACTVFTELNVCANGGTCEVVDGEATCQCTELFTGPTCNQEVTDDTSDGSSDILMIALPIVGALLALILILIFVLICRERQKKNPTRGRYRENLVNDGEFVDNLGRETYKTSPAYHRDWPSTNDNPYKTTVYHSYDGPAHPPHMPSQPKMRVVPMEMPEGQAGQRISYVSTDA